MAKSIFKENESNKAISFKQNKNLNDIILELSSLLKPIQNKKQDEFSENKYPIGFIIGNPRSGTTLMLQWLASLKIFSYPTNILNRFAYAPYIGALIQQMLYDKSFDFHNEFNSSQLKNNFQSDLGKTKGALSVSEFQHFFRNYMPNFDPEFLNQKELANVDFNNIKKGLASIENAFGKPFVLKCLMLQYNLLDLFKNIPNAIFIFIKRDALFNMQSLILARERYYNNRELWLSVKPKAYEFLKDLDIYHQVAGQVYYSNKEIENSLKKIPSKNKLVVNYESFCENPELVYHQLIHKYESAGLKTDNIYFGEKYFSVSNKIILKVSEIKKLKEAYNYFEKKDSLNIK